MIERFLEKVVRRELQHMPAVAILGPRQVGKTTLAQQLAKQDRQAVYLDLELPADEAKLTDARPYLQRYLGRLVIIDAVQRAVDLFRILRGLIDAARRAGHRTGQILLLGSASQVLLAQSAESLAGRVAYVEMTPLHLGELQEAGLETLWWRGGFPESFLAADDSASWRWRDNFIRTYLERDIRVLAPRLASTAPASFVDNVGAYARQFAQHAAFGQQPGHQQQQCQPLRRLVGRPSVGAALTALLCQHQKAPD